MQKYSDDQLSIVAQQLMARYRIGNGQGLATRLSPAPARNNRDAIERWVILNFPDVELEDADVLDAIDETFGGVLAAIDRVALEAA
ncbi:MAG: hypothetical protein K0U79_18800 [Gammaproteobacteria bacterium]|nr:hypothetical protein [Gammaproteobacteria bacterium]